VRAVALHDNSIASGQLFVLARKTGVVIFDMDGTITVGDQEVVKQFLSEPTLLEKKIDYTMREGALSMLRAWVVKGYLPIYLSGRQGSYYNLTRDWLVKHRFPPGPVQLTDTHLPTLPMYFSVGNFKVNYMKYLRDTLGLTIAAVYGNTVNDIKAYEEMGVSKEVTFIVGPHGGKMNSIDIGETFTKHIDTVLAFPNAEVPAPNICIEW